MGYFFDKAVKKGLIQTSGPTPQAQNPTREDYLRNAAESDARLDRLKEEIRNPLALKVTDSVSKKLGNFVGGVAGGVVKTIERPLRSLMGGGAGVATGIKAATGDKQAQKDFQNNVNPFMTSEDMASMKSNDIKAPIKYGGKIAADVAPWLIPGGVGLKSRAFLGGASGSIGALAEDKPTLKSVVTQGVAGGAVGVGTGLLSKGVSKLRSRGSTNLRSGGSTPQIEPPTNIKVLPAGVVPEEKVTSIVPQNKSLQTVAPENTDIVTTNHAIEGEVVEPTSLVKKPQDISGKSTIDMVDEITYRRGGKDTMLKSFKNLLNEYGDIGKKISGLIDSYENKSSVKAATGFNKFMDSWKKLKTQTSSKPADGGIVKNDNEAVINYILDIYNGRKPTPVTDAQKSVAESFFKDVTLEPSELAGKLGLKAGSKNLGKPRPFIPLIPKDINKFKEAHLSRLMASGMDKAKATKTINEVIDEMFNPASKVRGTRFPGFENERFFEPQSYNDLVDFGYVDNLQEIAEKWSHKAWKRLEGIMHFGGKEYEGLNQVLDDLQKQGATPKDVKYLKDSFVTFLNGREMDSETMEKFYGTLKDISRTKLSPSSGLKQPLSLAQNIAIVGPKKSLKSLAKLVANRNTPEDKRIIQNAALVLNDRYDEVVFNKTGVTTGISNLKDYGKQMLSKDITLSDKLATTIRGFADLNFKLTGIRPLDAGIRKLSGYSGLEWIRDSLATIKSSKVSGSKRFALIEELSEFAFPNKNELLRIINDGVISDEQLSEAVHNFVKKTQFGVSRAELPASWSNSATGEVVTALRSYGFEQAQFVGRLWKIGKKTGNWNPLATYLASALAIGVTADKVVGALTKIKKDDSEDNMLNTVSDVIGQQLFGMYYDAYRYSEVGKAGLFGGPVAGEVSDVLKTTKKTVDNITGGKERPFKEVSQFVAKRTVGKVPVVGPEIMQRLSERRKSIKSGRMTRE